MSFVNNKRHAFIIQLWCEPREIESAPEEWRGIIEHTTTGERCAVFTTDDIIRFIGIHVAHLQPSQRLQDSMQMKLSRRISNETSDEKPPNED
jgi:hypothetical protein